MKNCVVKVSNLVKIFDKRKIIKNISFDVSENSVVGNALGMKSEIVMPKTQSEEKKKC